MVVDMKNYLTDEQMEAIYAESIQVESDSYEGQFILTQNQLKALMNLAVETAIGEPVGIFKGEFGVDVNRNMWFKSKAIGALPKLGAELHSIQELDN